MIKHYELFYLASMQVPETELDSIQTEVSGWITDLQGTITKQESWGRKKLAYPISKERFGFYFLSEFDFEPTNIKELEKKLRLHKLIHRYLLSMKKPLSAKDLLLQERAQKRIRTAAKAEKPLEPLKPAEEKREPKISIDELDKKLDELLDQDIID